MEKLFNFVPLLYTNKSEIYNAPFLILRNTESCVSRRNKETRYAGVRCLLFHYTRYLIVIPHFFFFFSFSNCLEIVAPRCVHDFAWPHPPFVFLVNFPIQLHRYLVHLSKNHRTTIDLKNHFPFLLNLAKMKMKISIFKNTTVTI